MKAINSLSTFFSILLALLTLNIISTTTTENKANPDPELKKDFDEILNIKKRSKILTCLAIVRNSLSEDNKDVHDAMKATKHDKSRSYDKILLTMLKNCEDKLSDADMEKILMPENVLTPFKYDKKLENVIKFDKNVLDVDSLEFSEGEKDILKELNDATQSDDLENVINEEDIGLFGVKVNQLGITQYIVVFIALVMVFVIVFGGIYMLKCKNKAVKKKNKKKKD